jgi:hypothetical protein
MINNKNVFILISFKKNQDKGGEAGGLKLMNQFFISELNIIF